MSAVRVRYPDGRGILRDVLKLVIDRGFAVDELTAAAVGHGRPYAGGPDGSTAESPVVEVTLQVHGRGPVSALAAELSEIPAVRAVAADEVHATDE
jgi:putative Mg2+ transporter-C (MgtC) family protein